MEGPLNVVMIFGVVVFFERCLSPQASSSPDTKTSLTTAKMRDGNMIPKPTSYLRRISVKPVEQSSRTQYGLSVIDPHRRADVYNKDALHDVWQWDYWCRLQPKLGKCGIYVQPGTLRRYYYEAEVDTCKPFMYSGCDGNKNNFGTFDECYGKCNGASRSPSKETSHSKYCLLQPSVGMCLALLYRYYYDVQTNECKTFIYGGCGGNQNRFDDITLCEQRCKKVEFN